MTTPDPIDAVIAKINEANDIAINAVTDGAMNPGFILGQITYELNSALTALRALEGCVVIERGDVPDHLVDAVEGRNMGREFAESVIEETAALVASQMKGE